MVAVTYSPGRHLGQLISSLEAATGAGAVLVCADNGSTDGVPQAAARDNDNVEFVSTGGNIGYGAAVNVGVGLSLIHI